jgi:hypothetical protein
MRKMYFFAVSLFVLVINQPAFSQTNNKGNNVDSLINTMTARIEKDSIRKDMEALQNFGTRWTLAPNRIDIAHWIRDRFVSYGLTDVRIDSFMTVADNYPWQVNGYVSKQFNVVATLPGTEHPECENIVGGHYDCGLQFPYDTFPAYGTAIPGADDNGSGTAGVLEIARVIAQSNYQPRTSFKFIAFAGEELGFFGSDEDATDARINHNKINMMINLDCIANGDSSDWSVSVEGHQGDEWLSNMAERVCQKYSSLQPYVEMTTDDVSDSYAYYRKGFPSAFIHEHNWSTLMHTLDDSVSNYNMEYCSEIARLALAMLVYEQEIPAVKLKDIPIYHAVRLSWNPVPRNNLSGYNVYKSLTSGQGFVKINSSPLSDTTYLDTDVLVGTEYYYKVTSTDSSGDESAFSNETMSAPLEMTHGILVVDDSELGLLNPTDSEIDAFYDYLMSNFSHMDYDTKTSGAPKFAELARFSSILWHINFANQSKLYLSKDAVKKYLSSGGKIFFTLLKPSYAFEHNTSYPIDFTYGDFEYDYLEINNFNSNSTSLFNSASPASSSFDTLRVDPLKTLSSNNYHMQNIEAMNTLSGADVIYTYNSDYDSLTSQGNMIGQPVGVELDTVYKVVLLSFPLYYMDSVKAKTFTEYVFSEIFNEPLSLNEHGRTSSVSVFPNPCSEYALFDLYLSRQSDVVISVYDITGRLSKKIDLGSMPSGKNQIRMSTTGLMNGIYFCNIESDDGIRSVKIIVSK